MFDSKCKDCIVLKRIKNAFIRNELKMEKHMMTLLLLMSREDKF